MHVCGRVRLGIIVTLDRNNVDVISNVEEIKCKVYLTLANTVSGQHYSYFAIDANVKLKLS